MWKRIVRNDLSLSFLLIFHQHSTDLFVSNRVENCYIRHNFFAYWSMIWQLKSFRWCTCDRRRGQIHLTFKHCHPNGESVMICFKIDTTKILDLRAILILLSQPLFQHRKAKVFPLPMLVAGEQGQNRFYHNRFFIGEVNWIWPPPNVTVLVRIHAFYQSLIILKNQDGKIIL